MNKRDIVLNSIWQIVTLNGSEGSNLKFIVNLTTIEKGHF